MMTPGGVSFPALLFREAARQPRRREARKLLILFKYLRQPRLNIARQPASAEAIFPVIAVRVTRY
jgi:hypothetical protein